MDGRRTIANAVRFVRAMVRHARDGFQQVDDDTYFERLWDCRNCEQSHANANETWTCDACGCVLQTKARWRSERCPLDKW